jgi:hypothetical protein
MNKQQQIAKSLASDRGLAPVYSRYYSVEEENSLIAIARAAGSARSLLAALEGIEENGMVLDRFHTELKWLCERTLRAH